MLDIKFIYFDLDDTLLDHHAAEREALSDLVRDMEILEGIAADRLARTYQQINKELWERYGPGEISREQLQRSRFEDTLEALNLDGSRWEEVAGHYMQRYRNHWKWRPDAEKTLKKVGNAYPVGILTNGFLDIQKDKIERFSLEDYARHIVISEEVGYLKPRPEIFAHATRLTGLEPAQILYIGDSYRSDILGGSGFGWKTAWYTPRKRPENGEDADFIFERFENLISYLEVD
ncbi:MAG: HAD family hydrolase [Balneolaceae bacterium]|nr:HAD family hydrolase [Balneolaceae bacterium]